MYVCMYPYAYILSYSNPASMHARMYSSVAFNKCAQNFHSSHVCVYARIFVMKCRTQEQLSAKRSEVAKNSTRPLHQHVHAHTYIHKRTLSSASKHKVSFLPAFDTRALTCFAVIPATLAPSTEIRGS